MKLALILAWELAVSVPGDLPLNVPAKAPAPVCVEFCGPPMRPVFDPPLGRRPPEFTRPRGKRTDYENDLLTK